MNRSALLNHCGILCPYPSFIRGEFCSKPISPRWTMCCVQCMLTQRKKSTSELGYTNSTCSRYQLLSSLILGFAADQKMLFYSLNTAVKSVKLQTNNLLKSNNLSLEECPRLNKPLSRGIIWLRNDDLKRWMRFTAADNCSETCRIASLNCLGVVNLITIFVFHWSCACESKTDDALSK